MTIDLRANERQGDIWGEFRKLWAAINGLSTARRLENSAIAVGGIDVTGGSVSVRDGDIRVYNNGSISSQYPSGRVGFFVGPLVNADGIALTGMRVDRDVDAEQGDLILEVMEGSDGLTHIYNGYPTALLNQWRVWSTLATIDATSIYLNSPATTTDIANTVIDSAGQLRKIGSAAGLKLDIQPLVASPADVLRLQPVTWIDRGQHERGEPERRIAGLVAEQVAVVAADAPALAPLVMPDADGAPAGVAYERVPEYQQIVLVDHDERLAAAESEVTALRGELAEARAETAALRADLAALAARVDALTTPPATEAP